MYTVNLYRATSMFFFIFADSFINAVIVEFLYFKMTSLCYYS